MKAAQTLSLLPVGGVSETTRKQILLFWLCWVLDISSMSRPKCHVAIEYVSLYITQGRCLGRRNKLGSHQ